MLVRSDATPEGQPQAQYSLLLYPDGGVVDDILVYLRPSGESYLVVVNAANTDKDLAWLAEQRVAPARP